MLVFSFDEAHVMWDILTGVGNEGCLFGAM